VKQNIKASLIITWRLLFVLNFVVTMLILYIPLWVCFFGIKSNLMAHKIQVFWAKWLMLSMGIRTKIRRDEKEDSPVIYVANHTSALDIIAMYEVSKSYFHFVSKKEWAETPVFGILFKKSHIPLDRSSKMDSFKAMQKAKSDLLSGVSIVIFPEGTMRSEKGKISSFKSGAFKLSVETGVPIVPVIYPDNLKRLPFIYNLFHPNGGPGNLRIQVLQKIDPLKFDNDERKLKEFVFTLMSDKLKEFENGN
jgi:1-acyl-sn-glycerol-3-phosphate acyltransferase